MSMLARLNSWLSLFQSMSVRFLFLDQPDNESFWSLSWQYTLMTIHLALNYLPEEPKDEEDENGHFKDEIYDAWQRVGPEVNPDDEPQVDLAFLLSSVASVGS